MACRFSLLARLLILLLLVQAVISQAKHPFSFWPDACCQAYLAWRVSEGDVLYRDMWDSHPPAMVLVASLFHLVLPGTIAPVRATFSAPLALGAYWGLSPCADSRWPIDWGRPLGPLRSLGVS